MSYFYGTECDNWAGFGPVENAENFELRLNRRSLASVKTCYFYVFLAFFLNHGFSVRTKQLHKMEVRKPCIIFSLQFLPKLFSKIVSIYIYIISKNYKNKNLSVLSL